MSIVRAAVAVVIAAATTLHAPAARADAAAEALFGEGRQLIAAGKIPEACDRFQRSQALEPKVGTLLNLGDCRERQGQLANAWAAFMDASSLAIRQNDDRATEAKRRAALIEPRLAHLTITVTGVPELAISRNGESVAAAAWNTSIPVDPGTQLIEARAPGYKSWSTRVELAAGAHGATAVPALEVDPDAPRPEVPVAPRVILPPLGRLAFGVALGGNSETDIVGGIRVVGGYAVPRGAIRATFSLLYTRWHPDDADPYHVVQQWMLGVGFDYLLAWHKGLASAAGLGAGIDVLDDNYDVVSSENWIALRASPLVVRLGSPRLELGLHGMFVIPSKIVVGVIGVDWYVW